MDARKVSGKRWVVVAEGENGRLSEGFASVVENRVLLPRLFGGQRMREQKLCDAPVAVQTIQREEGVLGVKVMVAAQVAREGVVEGLAHFVVAVSREAGGKAEDLIAVVVNAGMAEATQDLVAVKERLASGVDNVP